MKITKPDFFDEFFCLAGKCKSNCCKEGWQVDIDAKTLQKYCQSQDEFLQYVASQIVKTEKCGHCIKPNKNHQCPFLNQDGLCQIVLKKGEKYLNDVCRDYPRFYNFLPNKTEVGLGLGCEQVAKIVLSHKEKITFKSSSIAKSAVGVDDPNFKLICLALQNRDLSFFERAKQVCKVQNIHISKLFEVTKIFGELEWQNFQFSKFDYVDFQVGELNSLQNYEAENLAVMFLYRYFSNKKYRFLPSTKVAFSLFATFFIDNFLARENLQNMFENKIDVTNKFSKEFEYSMQNMQKVLEFLQKTVIF